MARENRLYQRGTSWVFRVRVPDRLRKELGKKEIHRSFGQVDYREAVKLARLESLKADALFAEADKRLFPASVQHGVASTDERLQKIARDYFRQLERSAAPVPFSEDERSDRLRQNEEDAANVSTSLNDAGLQKIALRVGREAGLDVSTSSRDSTRLVEAVQRALIEHHLRDADRAALRPEGTYDPLFKGADKSADQARPSLSFKEAVRQFKSAPERASVSPKTRAAYEFRYHVLTELIGGDRDVAEITRAELREVRDLLGKMPPNCTKRYPHLSLKRAILHSDKEGVAPMSAKSVQLYLDALNALFRWLTAEEMVARNPAVALRGKPAPEEASRRPFTTSELNQLFAHPHFAKRNTSGGWMYWLPRLALLTGARFAELLALEAKDVATVEGVPVLFIEPNAGRKLKTKGSRRFVPLHQTLLEMGVLNLVKDRKGTELLFPDAAGPKDMLTARNKEMGRRIRSVFPDKSLVFHSFRHTFKDAAQKARIPREFTAMLGGWDLPGGRAAMDGYGRDPLVKLLQEEINKIEYAGVDLRSGESEKSS
ncbi:site-specific integrase [Devosia subaequoris]|uniref:site-specific integrase n=1 Tax=Devosia subaequoris TaxID=395930 RepID=UPI0030B7F8DD